MRAFTKEWLKAANDDLLTIHEIMNNAFLTHIVAFHAQQCIEKAFKAILEEHEIDTPKIHSLIKLSKLLPISIQNIDAIMLERLDELYIESRYPGDMGLLPYGKPTPKDAKEFYSVADGIFMQVCTLLDISIDEIKSEQN
jgi:HEPN domain-containing protein